MGDRLGVVLTVMGPVALVALWTMDVIRPGSFVRRGIRDVSAWPWWFYGLCGLVVFFMQGAGAGLGVSVVAPPASPSTSDGALLTLRQQAVGAIVGSVLAAAAGLVLLSLVRSRTPGGRREHGLGVDWPRRLSVGEARRWTRYMASSVATALLAILFAFPLVQLAGMFGQWLSARFRGEVPDKITHDTLVALVEHKGDPWAWAAAASAVILTPVVEELLFRVYLQSALLRAMGRTWPAVLAASAVFAAIHLGGGVKVENAHVLLALFTLGAAMGVAYERTRNVLVPILMHMVFNGMNVALTAAG